MRRSFSRGSAMPETALVMSAVLIVFLGLIKLADVGYQQSETDAAAFVAAHEGSFASTTHQQTYGTSMAQQVFSVGGITRFPGTASAGVTAKGATNPKPNPGGDIMGSAYHTSGGLGIGQAFGGNFFNLHSFFIEPAAGAPKFKATDVSLQITKAQPPNCTTNNTATPSCSGNVLATPDPTDITDPYFTYACRALYYSALSNSSGFPPDPNKYFAPQTQDLFSQRAGNGINYVLPDSASLNGLTDQSGNSMTNPATANQPWPVNFQPVQVIGQTSINLASTRAAGMWLYPQTEPGGGPDPANQDGLAVGGAIGLALQPIFNFDGGGGKC